jgi:outer membrane receptor for ferrienterochelin and colicin
VVHCSYGIFYQAPSFELLYANPEFKFTEETGNLGIAGNSDLKPEKTVSGELGVKQGITPDMAVELTAYFRDISNLAGTRADEITIYGGTSWYNQYENSDFGLVRGFIIALDKRLSDSWSAALDYTYQVAEGDASDPNAIRNQIIAGNKPEVQMIRLDFDQTHTINFNLNYISLKTGELAWLVNMEADCHILPKNRLTYRNY